MNTNFQDCVYINYNLLVQVYLVQKIVFFVISLSMVSLLLIVNFKQKFPENLLEKFKLLYF